MDTAKVSIGFCLGASTVSYVKIIQNLNGNRSIVKSSSISHNGDPKGTFLNCIKSLANPGDSIVVTGRKFRHLVRLTTISEPQAVELAYHFINAANDNYSAIASIGGETFMVYCLDANGRINNVISKNQCASGTGEFFLQQIKRMNLNIYEASRISENVEPFKVSGRCSVFCKSDCTHALNKGISQGEVTAGLARMIAEKIEELLYKTKGNKFLLIGGVTQNKPVIDFLRKKISEIHIPDHATHFEALGAALYGLQNDVKEYLIADDILNDKSSSFVFHPPLENYKNKVIFKSIEKTQAKHGDRCILGLDVGSTTTKAVILRESNNDILASAYIYTLGNPIKAARQCYKLLFEQLPENINIIGLGVTGSGRQIAGLHALTDGVINEIVAHATAAVYFDEDVDTIFEIGGQDAKYTYLVNKVPADYTMNEACSAGTGSFLEESAWESLKVRIEDIEQMALRSSMPPNFSDQCAAFISSDIKTAQQESICKDDIIAGLVYSVCLNYVNRVKGNRQVGNKIFMQGGVCYNKAVPIAMAALTGKEIIVPPEPGLMGAFGVALVVKEKLKLGLLKEKKFSLNELALRSVIYKEPFECKGIKENCDRNCSINLIEIQGRKYPFGGACSKYYNLFSRNKIDPSKFNYVKKRQNLLFDNFDKVYNLPTDAKTIGMNLSFHTYTLYPMYRHFFNSLGFRVVLPDIINNDEIGLIGASREITSMCYPAQLSHGLFNALLEKNPDYYFIPNHLEMYSHEKSRQRLDFNCCCIFVSGEPYYLKQAFRDYELNGQMISPILNFGNGWDKEPEKFIDIARQLGILNEKKVLEIYYQAVALQKNFSDKLFAIGKEFLKIIESNPDEFAIVLVGRPYNAFTDLANKGIPQKFASQGIYVIPYDILDYREENIDDDMYWEGGKKILRASKVIKKHPQLFGVYISNYSCAPDSILIPQFRNIMGTKPSLTLELDGHTADAGLNTRIEAFLDIIKNYRKISKNISYTDLNLFVPARVEINNLEAFYISSDDEKIPLSDNRVEILIPGMGDLASRLFAAGMKAQGFNAIPLIEGNTEVLKYGRSVTTGKECLPLLLCAGSIIDYIENKWDGKHYLAFFIVQGAGNCRLGYYPSFIRDIIKKKRLKNVATVELMHEDGFAGLGPDFSLRGIQTLIISDVLDDIRSGILAYAVDVEKGLEIFEEEFKKLIQIIENCPDKIFKGLKNFSITIKKKIPSRIPITKAKYIALVGEMYVRRDGFAHKWLNKYFAQKGFVLKNAYVSEWIFYVDYLLKKGLYEPIKSLKNKYERILRITYMRYAEYRIKKILEESGYYKFEKTRIEPLVRHGSHIVPLEFKGEPLLILGTGIHYSIEKYCGIVNVGPFGCMQTRFAEAVTLPEMNVSNKISIKKMHDPDYKLHSIFNGSTNIPFLSIETDGNTYPQVIESRLEAFTLQATRMAELMQFANNGSGKLTI